MPEHVMGGAEGYLHHDRKVKPLWFSPRKIVDPMKHPIPNVIDPLGCIFFPALG